MATQTQAPAQTPCDRIGGIEPLRRLAERFYALMETDPAYADLDDAEIAEAMRDVQGQMAPDMPPG